MFTCYSRNFRAIGCNPSISEKVKVIVQFCTITQGPNYEEAQKSSKSGKTVQGIVQSVSELLSMKWNRRFRDLTMFVFNFGVGSLEQNGLAGSARNFRFPWQFPSLSTTFSKPTTKNKCFLQCFCCLNCFSAAVAKENLLKTPAIVSLTNFQTLLRLPGLAFDWLSGSFFDY